MTKRQSYYRGAFLLAAAVMFGTMVMTPCRANADIIETNNAGNCSGGGSAGGGLCVQSSPGVYAPYSLSGLLSGAYGPIVIGSGTTEYVVTDDISGGSFSFTYNLTAFTNGTTPPVAANNATCQVAGATTADFAKSSVACTIVDIAGTNTGTINSSGAFTTGQQINNALSPMTITFNATNGYGKTFDLGFVSMQNTGTVTGTVTVPEGGSTAIYLLLSLFIVPGVVWLKRKAIS
jgi:hypothetical protein